MARRVNYKGEKRAKELARLKKQQEKKARKKNKQDSTPTEDVGPDKNLA